MRLSSIRFNVLLFLFFFTYFGSLSFGAGAITDGLYCIGDRNFSSTDPRMGFEFTADKFRLTNAYWLAVLSYNLYSDKGLLIPELTRWGFKKENIDFFSEQRTTSVTYADTQAVWAENEKGVLLAFRGTTPTTQADLITLLRLDYHPTRLGKVNLGFYGALEVVWDDIYKKVMALRKRALKPIWITGHSLGGALAQIAAGQLLAGKLPVQGMYTYGAPRAGDDAFRHRVEVMAYNAGIRENMVRVQNSLDVVTRVPPTTGLTDPTFNPDGWAHIGRVKYLPGLGDKVELWTSPEDLEDIPQYSKDLPLERMKEWFKDHEPNEYIRKIEQILFQKKAECP